MPSYPGWRRWLGILRETLPSRRWFHSRGRGWRHFLFHESRVRIVRLLDPWDWLASYCSVTGNIGCYALSQSTPLQGGRIFACLRVGWCSRQAPRAVSSATRVPECPWEAPPPASAVSIAPSPREGSNGPTCELSSAMAVGDHSDSADRLGTWVGTCVRPGRCEPGQEAASMNVRWTGSRAGERHSGWIMDHSLPYDATEGNWDPSAFRPCLTMML